MVTLSTNRPLVFKFGLAVVIDPILYLLIPGNHWSTTVTFWFDDFDLKLD